MTELEELKLTELEALLKEPEHALDCLSNVWVEENLSEYREFLFELNLL